MKITPKLKAVIRREGALIRMMKLRLAKLDLNMDVGSVVCTEDDAEITIELRIISGGVGKRAPIDLANVWTEMLMEMLSRGVKGWEKTRT